MSQENLQTMIMQNFGGGVKEVYYGIVQVVNKNRVQFPEDWLGTPTWLPFLCLGTPTWPP